MITAQEFQEWLEGELNPTAQIVLLDAQYSLFTEQFIKGEFLISYHRERVAKGLTVWVAERNDCNHYATSAWTFAQDVHALSSGKETGVAFGFLVYTPDGGTVTHCRNFAAAMRDGKKTLLILEPQTSTLKTLSQDEKDSITFACA